jgi:hypothetical protein
VMPSHLHPCLESLNSRRSPLASAQCGSRFAVSWAGRQPA